MIIYLENVCMVGCIYLATEKGELSPLLGSLFRGLLAMLIPFWFNCYSIMKLFFFLFYFYGGFLGFQITV